MSVTKIRPSGLFARKRTRLNPCAATLISNPSGRFRSKDLPPDSETGRGVSFSPRALAAFAARGSTGGQRREQRHEKSDLYCGAAHQEAFPT